MATGITECVCEPTSYGEAMAKARIHDRTRVYWMSPVEPIVPFDGPHQ
jgi:hypothetical protein